MTTRLGAIPEAISKLDRDELLREIISASRRKHLKRDGMAYGEWFIRVGKILLSPKTGSISDRVHAIRDAVRRDLRSLQLESPQYLPRTFVRLDPWEAEYLYGLASHIQLGCVEIGRLLGGSTFLLASATSKPIWSIDINPKNDDSLLNLLGLFGHGEKVQLIIGDSRVRHENVGQFDLLFIDGDHSVEGCFADIMTWWPKLAPGGHMVFHDCYFGCGVQGAVMQFLRESPDAEVIVGPIKPANHQWLDVGSLCHIRKSAG